MLNSTPRLLRLPEDILRLQLIYSEEIDSCWEDILSPDEIRRRSDMRSSARQRSFVLGRIALRRLMGDILGVHPSEVLLSVHEDGRVVSTDSAFHVSISHSADRAVAVASKRRVGVDLERITEKPVELLDYILHDEERAHIHGLPLDQNPKLFLSWTLKEAALKASGSGLRKGPRSVRIRADLERGIASVRDADEHEWHVIFETVEDFVVAVAFDPT